MLPFDISKVPPDMVEAWNELATAEYYLSPKVHQFQANPGLSDDENRIQKGIYQGRIMDEIYRIREEMTRLEADIQSWIANNQYSTSTIQNVNPGSSPSTMQGSGPGNQFIPPQIMTKDVFDARDEEDRLAAERLFYDDKTAGLQNPVPFLVNVPGVDSQGKLVITTIADRMGDLSSHLGRPSSSEKGMNAVVSVITGDISGVFDKSGEIVPVINSVTSRESAPAGNDDILARMLGVGLAAPGPQSAAEAKAGVDAVKNIALGETARTAATVAGQSAGVPAPLIAALLYFLG